MARVGSRASRKAALPIFKKHHHRHQRNPYNAINKRHRSGVFDTLALTSFHTFSLSLRRRLPPKPRALEEQRLSARRQDRRWLSDVILKQHGPMCPSKRERLAFIALSQLPTDQAIYEALTEEKELRKVKMLYARLFKERDRARREQGIKYYGDVVADWWVVQNAEKEAKEAKEAKKAKKVKKAKSLKKRREKAKQREREGGGDVDWKKLGSLRPEEKGKGREIFEINMPLRGLRF